MRHCLNLGFSSPLGHHSGPGNSLGHRGCNCKTQYIPPLRSFQMQYMSPLDSAFSPILKQEKYPQVGRARVISDVGFPDLVEASRRRITQSHQRGRERRQKRNVIRRSGVLSASYKKNLFDINLGKTLMHKPNNISNTSNAPIKSINF